MYNYFLNPWNLLAGLLLVSVPIVIHLINRLRFKRVHWAAMEFVLRAQKRMKRKMILQQLLLLLLRCLLVFLLGLLAARFFGLFRSEGRETRSTIHLIMLDDSPSMGDAWKEESGAPQDSFAAAKTAVLEQILPAAGSATNPQTFDVMLLSKPDNVESFDRVNAESTAKAKTYLNTVRPGTVSGRLATALEKLRQTIVDERKGNKDVARIVHVLSDYRSVDWEADGKSIRTAISELTKLQVKVHLIDVAHPYRKDDGKAGFYHDNIAITGLTSTRRVVGRFEQTEFVLKVKNYGAADQKDLRFAISVNGDDNKGQSVVVPSLGSNQEEQVRFNLTFDRVGTQKDPTDGFHLVSARLETPENTGLAVDNVRHTVVEVREQLKILAVDGPSSDREGQRPDGIYLKAFATDVFNFQWETAAAADLAKIDLTPYSCVLLFNVPGLTKDAAIRLENYVRDGGGLGVFLGPDVKPAEYRDQFYKNGEGLLPFELPEQPSSPLTRSEILAKRNAASPRFVLKDRGAAAHEALFDFYYNERGREVRENVEKIKPYMDRIVIQQYWPIQRTGKAWTKNKDVRELYCMPNERRMGDYEAGVLKIAGTLPVEDGEFGKYKPVLAAAKAELEELAKSRQPLYKLAAAFDRLLRDQLSEGDPNEALLREFWAIPKNQELKATFSDLRDQVKFGDPLYLARNFGRGRVSLITTTAGTGWNDWANGLNGMTFYPIIMRGMTKYLTGGATGESHAAGEPIAMTLDPAKYRSDVTVNFATVDYSENTSERVRPVIANKYEKLTLDVEKPKAEGETPKEGEKPPEGIEKSPEPAKEPKAVFNYANTDRPGIYVVTLLRGGTAAGQEGLPIPEYVAYAVNVDAARESDLARTAKEDIVAPGSPGAVPPMLHSVGDSRWVDELKNRRRDWSEIGWLFLILILVLIGEQALSSKLSYNSAVQDPKPPARQARRAPEPAGERS